MKIQFDQNGKICGYSLSKEQLKRQRMWIRARIGLRLPSVEQVALEQLIETHLPAEKEREPYANSPTSQRQLYDDWCIDRCELDREEFVEDLRKLARGMGLKHWRLRE